MISAFKSGVKPPGCFSMIKRAVLRVLFRSSLISSPFTSAVISVPLWVTIKLIGGAGF